MALITWTKEQFGTNISVADDQHKTLFKMLNELHDLAGGSDRAAIGRSLDALVKFVVDHFATEEKLMQMHNYPDFDAHKAEHTKLLETCGGLGRGAERRHGCGGGDQPAVHGPGQARGGDGPRQPALSPG